MELSDTPKMETKFEEMARVIKRMRRPALCRDGSPEGDEYVNGHNAGFDNAIDDVIAILGDYGL